jgi:hypothetical protein
LAFAVLKFLLRGLLGRLLGYAGLCLGFWLLYQGLSGPSPLLLVAGAAAVIAAMYLMVLARRGDSAAIREGPAGRKAEGRGDSLDGSGQGG